MHPKLAEPDQMTVQEFIAFTVTAGCKSSVSPERKEPDTDGD